MKLISTFLTFTPTASSSAAGFPASNVALLDPGKRWKAGSFATTQTMTLDLGSMIASTSLFLNNVNFNACTITYYNASDVLVGTVALSPLKDKAGKRKGIVTSPATCKKIVVSILITAALDNLEAVPAIGNAIVGTADTIPTVSQWAPEVLAKSDSFLADGGSYSKSFATLQRHVISMTCEGSKAEIDAMPLAWTVGVIYADLGSVADAFLVYRPERLSGSTKSVLDCSVSLAMEERV